MPLQNRVTPFGDIIATPERGLLTGNRGIIHDPATRTLLTKRWATKAWLVCTCDFQGVRRDVMARRSWTELFFLDEATALAAGHRPCFFCRREAAERFRAAWVVGNGAATPSAATMDAALHRERLRERQKRLHPLTMPIGELPDGAAVAAAGEALVSVGGRLLRWTPAGYLPTASPVVDALLTPPSTLAALRAGYRPVLHPSSALTGAPPIP
ncbi:MAG: hypothetical protein AB7I59_14825 [Geminicoccaceae bacterium]